MHPNYSSLLPMLGTLAGMAASTLNHYVIAKLGHPKNALLAEAVSLVPQAEHLADAFAKQQILRRISDPALAAQVGQLVDLLLAQPAIAQAQVAAQVASQQA